MIADDDQNTRSYHEPVLCREAVTLLLTQHDGIYIDGTIGGGGHTRNILSQVGPKARVIGIDQDEDAVTHCSKVLSNDGRLTVIHRNYSDIQNILSQLLITHIDGALLDLGVSSWQIDSPHRGFSYRMEGDLDMRMNRTQMLRAFDVLQSEEEGTLAEIFYKYGEEHMSARIAKAIVRARETAPIRTTAELTAILQTIIPERFRTKTYARIFQALRIFVNDELNHLEKALRQTLPMIRRGGRLVVITYHSLEDRIVKTFFKEESKTCVCPPRTPVCVCGKIATMKTLTPKPILPDAHERIQNPRARSAKLRAAEKII